MTDEKNINPEAPYVPPEVTDAPEMEFKSSPEAIAAAEAALVDISKLSFAGRHAHLGKMINCQVCGRRHRRAEFAIREHRTPDAVAKATIEVLFTNCEQQFKEMWVEEDLETGELSIQYAMVPLPGQGRVIKGKTVFSSPGRAIMGAAMVAKKRRQRRPNHTQLEVVDHTRRIFARINPERFPEEAGRMLEAKRIAINTVNNKRERKARKIRQAQKTSRRINHEK